MGLDKSFGGMRTDARHDGSKEVGTESSDVGGLVGREEMASCRHMGLHAEAQD